jgi:hypothetical protein
MAARLCLTFAQAPTKKRMFLKSVYRHSKLMFAGMVLFATVQLAVNYKKGMVFAPFLHYGMYSAAGKPDSVHYIPLFTAGADTLKGLNFSPQHWDRISYNYRLVLQSACDSHFYHTQVKRLYEKAGLQPPPPQYFINAGSPDQKLDHYLRHTEAYFGFAPGSLQVHWQLYKLSNGQFLPAQGEFVTSIPTVQCR